MNWDWSQVLYAFIGSFFGFLLALAAQAIITLVMDCRRLERIQESMKNELKKIYDAFNRLDLENLENKEVFISTPIWDSLVSTGDLFTLLKKEKDYYNSVIAIHYRLHAIAQMWKKKEFEEHIRNEIKDVCKLIKELILIRSSHAQ